MKEFLNTNDISDGYHTFGELYEHRINLFIALCKFVIQANYDKQDHSIEQIPVWKSKLHNDGSEIEGWFIMGINTEQGKTITYHLPICKWNYCKDINTLDNAPKWDGHTSNDVLQRLLNLD